MVPKFCLTLLGRGRWDIGVSVYLSASGKGFVHEAGNDTNRKLLSECPEGMFLAVPFTMAYTMPSPG